MHIRLTPAEYVHAAHAGFMRQASNTCKGRIDAYGYSGIGYDLHIQGAIAEFVVAKAMRLFWTGLSAVGASDVAGLQVRSSANHNYRLIVHPGDPDDAPFVLVTGNSLEYVVRGWIYGSEAKQQQYWQEPVKGRPAYFVPQSDLHSIDELQEVLNGVIA